MVTNGQTDRQTDRQTNKQKQAKTLFPARKAGNNKEEVKHIDVFRCNNYIIAGIELHFTASIRCQCHVKVRFCTANKGLSSPRS